MGDRLTSTNLIAVIFIRQDSFPRVDLRIDYFTDSFAHSHLIMKTPPELREDKE